VHDLCLVCTEEDLQLQEVIEAELLFGKCYKMVIFKLIQIQHTGSMLSSCQRVIEALGRFLRCNLESSAGQFLVIEEDRQHPVAGIQLPVVGIKSRGWEGT
jgi:hypothetical protein